MMKSLAQSDCLEAEITRERNSFSLEEKKISRNLNRKIDDVVKRLPLKTLSDEIVIRFLSLLPQPLVQNLLKILRLFLS